jgi:PAS domain-containing protein
MANEVAVRLCGFKNEEEMVGKTDYDIFPRDRADAYVQDDRFVFDTGEALLIEWNWHRIRKTPSTGLSRPKFRFFRTKTKLSDWPVLRAT